MVVVIGYWLCLWHKSGSSGGNRFCKGGSCNSLRSAIISVCGGGGDCEGLGPGGGIGSGGGLGQEKNHHNHY